ncbi:MAG: hypothetical protein HGB04_06785 [Chlorobiaceae bacterium]|nr:hypothetical protein [Chlorobiaceae bacterium]
MAVLLPEELTALFRCKQDHVSPAVAELTSQVAVTAEHPAGPRITFPTRIFRISSLNGRNIELPKTSPVLPAQIASMNPLRATKSNS